MAMITNDWLPAVREEFAKPYYRQLYQFVKEEYSRTVVYLSLIHISLSAHEPFDWSNEAVRDELAIVSHQEAVEYRDKRMLVGDTDVGKRMMIRIEERKKLIQAYQDGEIAERDASSAYKW